MALIPALTRRRAGLVAAIALCTASAAEALPVASTSVRAGCTAADPTIALSTSADSECDFSFQVEDGTYNVTARALASLGNPQADVQTNASLVGPFRSSKAFVTASASVDFFWQVSPSAAAPTHVPFVPIAMSVEAHGSADFGSASVRISRDFQDLFRAESGAFNSFDHDETLAFNVAIGVASVIHKEASCRSETSITFSVRNSGCQAVADPLLGFDQAAFDLQQAERGLQSFALADFFVIETSPGVSFLAAAVPEPVMAAFLLAAAALARRLRATAQSRSGAPSGKSFR
jgi:hypothetical protein